MVKRIKLFPGIFLIGVLLSACAPKDVSLEATAPANLTRETQVTIKETWGVEWDKTLMAAKKEGKIYLYNTMASVPARDAITENFKKKYGIEVHHLMGSGAALTTKILTERRAGLYVADVYIGGGTTINQQLKPAGVFKPLDTAFILPELKDPEIIKKNWWGGDFRWLDDSRLSLAMLTYVTRGITINSELVRPGEIKGYADLLNPKWKGKIIFDDPTQAGSGGKLFGVAGAHIMGWDYWEKFVKQEPVILVDQRLMTEWIARGRYPVGLGLRDTVVLTFIEAGAPLEIFTAVEGGYVSSGSSAIAIFDKAPNPDAAKIFINWILTQEGQAIFVKPQEKPSSRTDVSIAGMDPGILLKSGVQYIDSDTEKFSLEQSEHFERAKKLFAPLLR